MTLFAGIFQFQKIQGPQWKGVTSEATGQVSFSIKASAISVNVTPILPRTFIRGSLARAQATLPLNAYAFTPITIDPLTCAPGDGTRINSAQKPPAETSLVKAVELTPVSPAFKSILQRRRSLGFDLCFLCTVTSITKCPPRLRARGAVRLAIVSVPRWAFSRLPILDRVVANHCSRVSSEAGEERSALERRGERS